MKNLILITLLALCALPYSLAHASNAFRIDEYRPDGRVNHYAMGENFLSVNQKKVNLPALQYKILDKKMSSLLQKIKSGGDLLCLPSERWEFNYDGKLRRFCSDLEAVSDLKAIASQLVLIGGP